jgi:hypothetical protein
MLVWQFDWHLWLGTGVLQGMSLGRRVGGSCIGCLIILLAWSGFHLGNGLRAEWWLMFPARAGHRDGMTC